MSFNLSSSRQATPWLILVGTVIVLGLAGLWLARPDAPLSSLLPFIGKESAPSAVPLLINNQDLVLEVNTVLGEGQYRVWDLTNFNQAIEVLVPADAVWDDNRTAVTVGSYLVVSEYLPVSGGIVASRLGLYADFPAKFVSRPSNSQVVETDAVPPADNGEAPPLPDNN